MAAVGKRRRADVAHPGLSLSGEDSALPSRSRPRFFGSATEDAEQVSPGQLGGIELLAAPVVAELGGERRRWAAPRSPELLDTIKSGSRIVLYSRRVRLLAGLAPGPPGRSAGRLGVSEVVWARRRTWRDRGGLLAFPMSSYHPGSVRGSRSLAPPDCRADSTPRHHDDRPVRQGGFRLARDPVHRRLERVFAHLLPHVPAVTRAEVHVAKVQPGHVVGRRPVQLRQNLRGCFPSAGDCAVACVNEIMRLPSGIVHAPVQHV